MNKISVIIPVFQSEKYISKCIESIVNQTYDNWELLLVDDGSTDNSGIICDEYANMEPRIKVFHKKNEGVSSARNMGLDEAQGDWICFVDSDDYVAANYLKDFKLRDAVKYNSCLVSQNIIQFYPKQEKEIEMFKYDDDVLEIKNDISKIKELNILMNGCPVAKLFNKKIIDKYNLRFDTNLSLNEDHLFVMTYLLYIDYLILVNKTNYRYLYDFSVPSLTKITHPSSESIKAAYALYDVYEKFINKYLLNIKDWENCSAFFGPAQLIRASKDCFCEKNSYYKQKEVFEISHMIINKNISLNTSDIYSKFFIALISRKYGFLTYISLLSIFVLLQILKYCKFYIKIVIVKINS